MKHKISLRIVRKFVILLLLIGGAIYFGYQNNSQSVMARPCCSSCPGGGDPGNVEAYCENKCSANDDRNCLVNCIAQADRCYNHCVSCGGGGPRYCEFDTQCPPGEFCTSGTCQ